MNTLPESMNTLPESMNTLPESMNTLPESMNTLPESMNTLPESMNTLPESVNALPTEMVNGLPEFLSQKEDRNSAVTQRRRGNRPTAFHPLWRYLLRRIRSPGASCASFHRSPDTTVAGCR
jgi:hypothetical protein